MYPTSDIAATRQAGRPIRMTLPTLLRWITEVYPDRVAAARDAFRQMAAPLPHTGGGDTGSRLAHRLAMGATPDQAAAREYLYRWCLALDSHANAVRPGPAFRWTGGAFGVPHALGL